MYPLPQRKGHLYSRVPGCPLNGGFTAVGIGKLCKTVRVILQTVNHESTCSCYAAGKAFLPTIPTDLQRVGPGIVMKCGCDVHNVTTAIILKIVLRLLPTFAGVFREKIRTRASFAKILGNCILDKNVNNCSFDKNLI